MTRGSAARHVLCSVLLCLLCNAHSIARAEDDHDRVTRVADPKLESARKHFKRGVTFFKHRDYGGALIEFRAAYELRPNYKVLYNLGQASIEIQDHVGAIDYLTRYLREGANELPVARRKEVARALLSLEGRVATLSVSSNQEAADIYVDGTRIGRVPHVTERPLNAGRHKIVAKKAGLPDVEDVIELGPGEARALRLDFEPALATAEVTLPEPAPRVPSAGGIGPAVIWSGVATSALLISGLTMSIVTAGAEQDYQALRGTLTTAQSLDDARRDAKTKALVTDVLWGASIAAATLTAVLYLNDDGPNERGPQVALHPSKRGGALSVRASF